MDSKTYDNVDAALWERVRAIGEREHGTAYRHDDDHSGSATTATPIGSVELGYTFDPEKRAITYTIVRKPMLVASGLIWNGIADTIERCRKEPSGTA